MSTDPIIRPWERPDHDALIPMILDCIATNAEAGSDILPTLPNAERLWRRGLTWAELGDPTLVLEIAGERLAWTCWGGLPEDFLRTHAICWGMGTYVRPDVRGQGVASRLRREARRIAARQGYGKVVGTTFHEAGLRSSEAVGFRVVGQQVEWRL